jgi:hypothetical protein
MNFREGDAHDFKNNSAWDDRRKNVAKQAHDIERA